MLEVDYRLLMDKLNAFEEKLKKLEGDITSMSKRLPPQHFPYQSDNPDAPYYRPVYTAYALSAGNFQDSGLPQAWKLSTTTEDYEE